MEEIIPTVGATLSLANPVFEKPAISIPVETTRVKLVTDTSTLLGKGKAYMDNLSTTNTCRKGQLLVNDVSERLGLLPDDDPRPDIIVPIAVEIEGHEKGKILANVVSVEERSILRGEISANECSGGPAIKESSIPLSSVRSPTAKSVFELDCVPLWGSVSICGRRPDMEDAVKVEPHFMEIPIEMFVNEVVVNGMSRGLSHLSSHFFGVYDGHGGSQVANYCRDRVHGALVEEFNDRKDQTTNDTRQTEWEKVFKSCFLNVDDEIGGKVKSGIPREDVTRTVHPIASETVGSTAVVAVVCSSHIIVANCGDSRAVLCRGKEALPLSIDHKPSRKDEYARIEASGGKVIQWDGARVCGVLAMSRSIGDRYLKPWIISEPEVMFVPRAKEDECIVLASDGLWDVVSNEEACEVVRKRILIWHKKNGTDPLLNRGHGVDPAAQAAAEYLCNLALQGGSNDNISVIVVDLKSRRKFKTKS